MKVLIIGSGAREHALAFALFRSAQKPEIYCIGSNQNPGIMQYSADYLVGDINDCSLVTTQAALWDIDIAIVGPEAPLAAGIADALWQVGVAVIGPQKDIARIETSKEFARHLMAELNIPGLPDFRQFTHLTGVEEFLITLGEGNYVIKANGLMGGKGVKVAGEHLFSFAEAIQFCEELFAAGQSIVIEQKLIGQEFSLICLADGKRLIPMPLVQDHKRAYQNDRGPNTGGMGSYTAPDHALPFLTAQEVQTALAINTAVFQVLNSKTSTGYIGFLYGSFIATATGVFVIEFNARLGDPEALNLLSLLESDFLTLCTAMVTGQLNVTEVVFKKQASVCKYAVPLHYPNPCPTPFAIDYSDVHQPEQLFLGAVTLQDDQIIATGSRTAAYVAIADTIAEAEAIAEKEISAVKGELYHRQDIGTEQLIAERMKHMDALRNGLCV